MIQRTSDGDCERLIEVGVGLTGVVSRGDLDRGQLAPTQRRCGLLGDDQLSGGLREDQFAVAVGIVLTWVAQIHCSREESVCQLVA